MTALIPNADTKPIDLARVLELFTTKTDISDKFGPQTLASPYVTTIGELDLLVDYCNTHEWLSSADNLTALNFLLLVIEAEKDKVSA